MNFKFNRIFSLSQYLTNNFTIIYENGNQSKMQSIIPFSEWKSGNSKDALLIPEEMLFPLCLPCHSDEVFASSATQTSFFLDKVLINCGFQTFIKGKRKHSLNITHLSFFSSSDPAEHFFLQYKSKSLQPGKIIFFSK